VAEIYLGQHPDPDLDLDPNVFGWIRIIVIITNRPDPQHWQEGILMNLCKAVSLEDKSFVKMKILKNVPFLLYRQKYTPKLKCTM
jgi:hypothetical protein